MGYFFKDYKGPRGPHLNCLTKLTLTGHPKETGNKRPGKALMQVLGKNYDPHKSRFDLSEDDQVTIELLTDKKRKS